MDTKIYQVQLDGIPVGQYQTFEDAENGVNIEIYVGTDPSRLRIEKVLPTFPQ